MSDVVTNRGREGPHASTRVDAAICAVGVVSHGARSLPEFERYVFGPGADPTPISRFDTSRYVCRAGFHASEVPVDAARLERSVRAVVERLFIGARGAGAPTDELCSDLALQTLAVCADQILAEPGTAELLGRGPGMVALSTCSGTLSASLGAVADEVSGDELRPDRLIGVDPLFMPAVLQAYLGTELNCSRLSFCNTACSSSTEAIGRAAIAVTAGEVPWAIAGGFDQVNEVLHAGFDLSKVLSRQPGRPFSIDRAGFQLGDGAGLCLIAAPDARARDHPVRIVGLGVGLDGYHLTAPDPMGRGLALAVRQAVGPRVGDLAGIVGHGTGTPHNDIAEAGVYERLLEARDQPVPLTSLKSKIGHTLGAAGVHGVLAGMISLTRRELPGIRNLSEPIATENVAVSVTNQKLGAGSLLVSSAAFGGHNATLLLEGPRP